MTYLYYVKVSAYYKAASIRVFIIVSGCKGTFSILFKKINIWLSDLEENNFTTIN